MCVCSINITGGTGVPCPPLVLPDQSLWAAWCLYASLGLAPVPSLALVSFWFFRCLDPILGFGVGLVGGGVLIPCFERLPEHLQSSPVFPFWSLHTNFVCRYPWSSDTPVCGPHQSDGNPTLVLSTCLWVGLLPLLCEATGFLFQGSCRLHPEKSHLCYQYGYLLSFCWIFYIHYSNIKF